MRRHCFQASLVLLVCGPCEDLGGRLPESSPILTPRVRSPTAGHWADGAACLVFTTAHVLLGFPLASPNCGQAFLRG